LELEEKLDQFERRLERIELICAEMTASNRLAVKLIKFVILPLILILGGLVGIKII